MKGDRTKDDVTRRDFLLRSSAVAATQLMPAANAPARKLNAILIISDQFRWDCLGANRRNPLNLTPNVDAMARERTNFVHAITNQPVCAPSRACLFTGQYPNRHGVWRNGLRLPSDATTIARVFRSAGHTANNIGKWHLAPRKSRRRHAWSRAARLSRRLRRFPGKVATYESGRPGRTKAASGTVVETRFGLRTSTAWTSSPTASFDFPVVTRTSPFVLVVSYLEPHFENDCNCFVAPNGYAERYRNSFVPRDLSFFPGDRQQQLPDYYGCIARVDDNVGRLRQELSRLRIADRTIVACVSDHGCHFRTRNAECKRTAHESSIHVPLVVAGLRFKHSRAVHNVTGHVALAPTLLDAVAIAVPPGMQGRSAMPLVENGGSVAASGDVFVQISESMTGRALRTPQWTYVVVAPDGKSQAAVSQHVEYHLYDLFADPHQLVNLAGRRETRDVASRLRERLLTRMAEAGEQPAHIEAAPRYR
jgi:arylsulfatase A-like enzyme